MREPRWVLLGLCGNNCSAGHRAEFDGYAVLGQSVGPLPSGDSKAASDKGFESLRGVDPGWRDVFVTEKSHRVTRSTGREAS